MEKRSLFLPIAVLVAAGFYLFATNYQFKEPKKIDQAALAALVKTDVKPGTGEVAAAGKTVFVHYTGWLYDETASGHQGKKFDSSRDRNQPFEFPLGGGQVIAGWEHGVEGMKVGGQRLLIIPPELAYGASGAGGVIPPNAKLVFDIELIAVK
ncbi:MAG TPA: FKBP-type peptidyl-prolyl cis-trans isomerase [Gallionellaceae bacterium]|nr:FKBP-type peptidyl-prolyl cis-trans isomerase [Gallionellaceae bacterium]